MRTNTWTQVLDREGGPMDVGAERSRVPAWRWGKTKAGRGQGRGSEAGRGRGRGGAIPGFWLFWGRIKRAVLCVWMGEVVSGARRSQEREMQSSRACGVWLRGGNEPEWGRARNRGGTVEGHGNGVVPGRELGGTEGGPRVRVERRMRGGPGTVLKWCL